MIYSFSWNLFLSVHIICSTIKCCALIRTIFQCVRIIYIMYTYLCVHVIKPSAIPLPDNSKTYKL